MNELCGHRAVHLPPATPEFFYEIAFPSRSQCIERGYGGVLTQHTPVNRPKRQKPFNDQDRK